MRGQADGRSEVCPRLPDVRSRECTATSARFELGVPKTLVWFGGHFPGHPVLPGVAQVGWAVSFAREAFGFPADPPRIERVKFQRPVGPGEALHLELSRHGDRVDWRFVRDDLILGRGRLEFARSP